MRLFKRNRCEHKNVRCIHGDEVNHYNKGFFHIKIARVFCTDCDSPLYDRPMLVICSDNNKPHRSRARQRWSWTPSGS